MLRIILLTWLLLALPLAVASERIELSLESAAAVDLLAQGGKLYHANKSVKQAPEDVIEFVSSLTPAVEIDRSGGSYWLHVTVRNKTDIQRWVVSPNNSLIDEIQIFSYHNKTVNRTFTGHVYSHRYALHYGADIELLAEQPVELLIYISSRYYSGQPRFELLADTQYIHEVLIENIWVLGCLGAVVVLSIYNLFVGVWIRDPSYLYYALYLAASVVGWAAIFNITGEWMNIYSLEVLLLPFFLRITFNILYYIRFLDLPKFSPWLCRFSYVLVFLSLVLALIHPFIAVATSFLILSVLTGMWVSTGLLCGIMRLRQGYKPARFFVAAFTAVFFGALVSILPDLGYADIVSNADLVALIAQTIDMLLLALALADRINILRADKELALMRSYQIEHRANETERDANEKLQRALDIAEEENERKSDFLRMVSHELRTPLHSIFTSSEQWSDESDPDTQCELVQYISYGASKLKSQVDNLVLLAETDTGNLEAGNYEFELRPLLDRLCTNLKGLIRESVDFNLKRTNALPVVLRGDAYLLEHMLRTVLENAIKYTENGKIDFNIQWDWQQQTLGFWIIDTGCGMTDEQQRMMYQNFLKVSRGLNKQSRGLGLGLTICYRLSSILCADLKIESRLGVGTEVHLCVPLEAVENQLAPTNMVKPQSSGRVLIVEDNVVNATILEKMVSRIGYQSDIVYSGQDALKILVDQEFDAILMDIQMPIMDGITATRWIRHRGITTPIIAVTANSDSEVRRRCMDLGMSDFLVKPVRSADIQRVLERQCS
jgi:two-component system, sensor histidine kinase LadS